VAVFAVSHDNNTQTFHRPHDATLYVPLDPIPAAPAQTSHVKRRPSAPVYPSSVSVI
jgi:hypothetical protein